MICGLATLTGFLQVNPVDVVKIFAFEDTLCPARDWMTASVKYFSPKSEMPTKAHNTHEIRGYTMTESGTDHRRKRSPTPPFSSKELSRFALPLVLSACLIVSVLLTFTIDDTSSGGQRDQRSRRLDVFRNPHIQQQQQRALLDGVGGDADVGLDENVWHRQLRAMKGEVRKQDRRNRPRRTRKTPHADESSRSMAAAAEDWTEAYAGGDRMRRMAVIPRYVSISLCSCSCLRGGNKNYFSKLFTISLFSV
jgi:hypothetical protein